MLVVLVVSNRPLLNRWTGVFAGVLVATYIAVEVPLSGMSMNPARTFASALPAQRPLHLPLPLHGVNAASFINRQVVSRDTCL